MDVTLMMLVDRQVREEGCDVKMQRGCKSFIQHVVREMGFSLLSRI
jgi:hypothetical protein